MVNNSSILVVRCVAHCSFFIFNRFFYFMVEISNKYCQWWENWKTWVWQLKFILYSKIKNLRLCSKEFLRPEPRLIALLPVAPTSGHTIGNTLGCTLFLRRLFYASIILLLKVCSHLSLVECILPNSLFFLPFLFFASRIRGRKHKRFNYSPFSRII